MKRLELVGMGACPRCRRSVAHLMTTDGEHTLAVALDAAKARELSRQYHEPVREKFVTDLLLELLSSSPQIPRQVVLELDDSGVLSARVDLTTSIYSCSPQEGVAIVAAAGIPLYAAEKVFDLKHSSHSPEGEGENVQCHPPKQKPTLH